MAATSPAKAGDEAPAPLPGPSPDLIERIALFLPDRLMDFLDMVSFGVGIGYGLDVHHQATCFLTLPALGTYNSLSLLNWYPGRNLCTSLVEEQEAGLGPLILYRADFFGGGSGWDKGQPGSGEKHYRGIGLASLDDASHREGFRDPWAVGGAWGPLLLSPRLELALHPVEIVDFLLGTLTFGLVDVCEDDWTSLHPAPPRQ